MKQSLILFIIVLSVNLISAQSSKKEMVADLFADAFKVELTQLDATMPIASINQLAKEKADKKMVFTKDNAFEAFEIAKKYKAVFVTVGGYTAVRITDFDDCRQSGSWGTAMPMGKGYVQKSGKLILKNDYINNIIGLPDNQERMIFMFE